LSAGVGGGDGGISGAGPRREPIRPWAGSAARAAARKPPNRIATARRSLPTLATPSDVSAIACAWCRRFEVSTTPAASSLRNFKSKSGTRTIYLPVPLCFRSSCQSALPPTTNFGSGELVCSNHGPFSISWRRTTALPMRMISRLFVALTALMLHVGPTPAAERSVAVFDFELIDTSLEGELNGPRRDEQARLAATSDQLRRRLAPAGQVTVGDNAPGAAPDPAHQPQAPPGRHP